MSGSPAFRARAHPGSTANRRRRASHAPRIDRKSTFRQARFRAPGRPGVWSLLDIRFGILTCSARDESEPRCAMSEDSDLKAKLAKLEALFRRAGSLGEKSAAGAAIERLQGRLAGSGEKREPEVELQYSLPDVWSAELFRAVCRKHGVRPYRYRRQRRTTVMVRAREREFDRRAWPEYCRLHDELADYFKDVTDHLISRVMGSGGSSSDPLELEGGAGQ